MTSPRPPASTLAAGALLGMCLATVTPGLLFVAQAIDALHGHSIALAFHALIAGWGGVAGALVVRERFSGNGRRSLLLVPLYVGSYWLTGTVYTLVQAAQAGSQAVAAFVMLGAISLGVTTASIVVALATWGMLRRFAAGSLEDSASLPDAASTIAKRASRWLLAASALQVGTSVFGGPVLAGVLAACAAVCFFLRARPRQKAVFGVLAGVCVALTGASVQATLWNGQAHDQQRAALPACSDGESDSPVPGAYGIRARGVPFVRDALAVLQLDPAQAPAVVYKVFVTLRPTPEADAADVQRAVEQALVAVDCNEGTQLGRVPFVVRAPGTRSIDVQAMLGLRAGTTLEAVHPDLEAKIRAALLRTPLSSLGPKLALPTANELTGVDTITWRVNGVSYAPGEALPNTGNVDLPVLGRLVLSASPPDSGPP
ncbi:MAG: hypothetical protein ABI548_29745 [Polyangiaceae bacterium]